MNTEWRSRYETAVEAARRRSAGPALLRAGPVDGRMEARRQPRHHRRPRGRTAASARRSTRPSLTTASSARSTATRPARPASAGSSTPSTAPATSSAASRSGPRWSASNTRANRSPASPRRRPWAHTWRALRGDGAYRGDRRIHVSDDDDLSKSLLFYSSLSWFLKAGTQDAFLELTRKTERQRGFGDFYGHVLVAQGSGEIMVEHGVHAWDVAALQPIVEEAGGRMTDWDGVRNDPPARRDRQQRQACTTSSLPSCTGKK